MKAAPAETEVRLDKWLWAARFFKTRSLAQQALEQGRVKVDGQKSRPSRRVLPGMTLSIEKGEDTFVISVLTLSDKRGKAEVAQQLYRESEADRAARLAAAEQRRLAWHSMPAPTHRPDKKQRRTLQHLKHQT